MVHFKKIKLTKGIFKGTEEIELEIPDIKWVLWDGIPRGGKRINHVNYWSILKVSDEEEAKYIKDKLKNIRVHLMYSYELIKDKIWVLELNDVDKTYDIPQMTTAHDLYNTYLKDLVFVEHTKYFRISSVFRIKEISHPDSVTVQSVILNGRFCFNRQCYNITTTINNCLPKMINFLGTGDIFVEVFSGNIANKWWYSAFNKAIFSYDFDLNFNEGDNIIWDADVPDSFNIDDLLSLSVVDKSEENVSEKVKEIEKRFKEFEEIFKKISKFNEQFKQ